MPTEQDQQTAREDFDRRVIVDGIVAQLRRESHPNADKIEERLNAYIGQVSGRKQATPKAQPVMDAFPDANRLVWSDQGAGHTLAQPSLSRAEVATFEKMFPDADRLHRTGTGLAG